MSMQRKTKLSRVGIVLFGVYILFVLFFSIKKISIYSKDVDSIGNKNVILQNKDNDCGPVALKMIFDHYHIPSTLNEIETSVKLKDKGTSMLALKEMAELKGLHAEGWRLTLEDLLKAEFPVILFVNGDHYFVADSALSDTLFVRDPTFGKLRLRINKLSEKWKGETLLFKKKERIISY
jgi:ABC-type bacteriocin/lantibiotic exporter with double-glycine peptidase domain